MTTYLHIAHGPYDFLVDIAHVLEVSDLAAADRTGAAALRCWRDRNLPVVDLGVRLGGIGGTTQHQVVLRDDADGEAACALDVERVVELLDVDDARLQPLGVSTPDLACLTDAAWPAPGGRCLLRLRAPFAPRDEHRCPGADTP